MKSCNDDDADVMAYTVRTTIGEDEQRARRKAAEFGMNYGMAHVQAGRMAGEYPVTVRCPDKGRRVAAVMASMVAEKLPRLSFHVQAVLAQMEQVRMLEELELNPPEGLELIGRVHDSVLFAVRGERKGRGLSADSSEQVQHSSMSCAGGTPIHLDQWQPCGLDAHAQATRYWVVEERDEHKGGEFCALEQHRRQSAAPPLTGPKEFRQAESNPGKMQVSQKSLERRRKAAKAAKLARKKNR